jgi:hypothetical protein
LSTKAPGHDQAGLTTFLSRANASKKLEGRTAVTLLDQTIVESSSFELQQATKTYIAIMARHQLIIPHPISGRTMLDPLSISPFSFFSTFSFSAYFR